MSYKVLMIDDEKTLCENFKSYMEMRGLECDIAHNGNEALEKLDSFEPDLLVLDVLMPSMDGYTFLRECSRRDQQIPCIVITGKEKLVDLFDMEGVVRFMPKPLDFGELFDSINEILDGNKPNHKEVVVSGLEKNNDFAGTKVLIIEDEEKLANNLKTFLEMQGFEVTHAINGEKGLDQLSSFGPDIVISDIIMPEMDGYSMLKRLKKEKPDVPVIILTGKERFKDLFEVEGISAFMTKPFNMDQILEKVKEILSKK